MPEFVSVIGNRQGRYANERLITIIFWNGYFHVLTAQNVTQRVQVWAGCLACLATSPGDRPSAADASAGVDSVNYFAFQTTAASSTDAAHATRSAATGTLGKNGWQAAGEQDEIRNADS